jgi:hypothetical protein
VTVTDVRPATPTVPAPINPVVRRSIERRRVPLGRGVLVATGNLGRPKMF